MNVLLNGRGGKVGSALAPRLEAAGHALVDELSSADVPGTTERLLAALPGLEEHRCSIGERGGFVLFALLAYRLQEAPEAPQPNHRLGKKARALGSGCSKANERRRHRRQRRSLRSSASPVRVAASASTTLQKIRFASGTRRGGIAR